MSAHRLFDRLFLTESPGEGDDFRKDLNPASLEVLRARVEPSLARADHGAHFQLERQGYFVVDPDSTSDGLVLGRTVTLKDSWARAAKPGAPAPARAKPARQQAGAAHELTESASALQSRLGVRVV